MKTHENEKSKSKASEFEISDIEIVGLGNEYFAIIRATVIIAASMGNDLRNGIETTVRVPCAPETDTPFQILERSRTEIVAMLRAAAALVEAKSIEASVCHLNN